MAEKIGPQHGIEAARRRWNEHVDPGKAWPDKLAGTLSTLVDGHNEGVELAADYARFKAEVEARPF